MNEHVTAEQGSNTEPSAELRPNTEVPANTPPRALSEQRRHRRLPASIRIFAQSGPSPFPEAVKDISIGGAHVLTHTPPAPGTDTTFSIHLPHHDAPLEIRGHVVWSSGNAFGVQFHGSEPRLRAYVDRLESDATRL